MITQQDIAEEYTKISEEKKTIIEHLPENVKAEWESVFKRLANLAKLKSRLESQLYDDNTKSTELTVTYSTLKQVEEEMSRALAEEATLLNHKPSNAIQNAKNIVDLITTQGLFIRPQPGDYTTIPTKQRKRSDVKTKVS